MRSITSPDATFSKISPCVGRTIDELSISAPPTPYYYFYARVSCRVCIVPKCAKAMGYLSSWAKSRKVNLLFFDPVLSWVRDPTCKSVPRLGKL